MLDLKFIRENPDAVKKAIKDKNSSVNIDELLDLDKSKRNYLKEAEDLRNKQNKASEEIAKLKREKKDIKGILEEMKAISQKEKDLSQKVEELSSKIDKLLLVIPNIPHKTVPIGPEKTENKVVREWGAEIKHKFNVRNHLEIGESLNILDFSRAAKISGSNFALFKGKGALLERALIAFMLDVHTKKHGYTEIFPPFLVNRSAMTGTGQLPKLEEDMYRLKDDDLFLIPTAEVPVTNLYAGEVFDEKDLPVYHTAYTACFRREAGSYGKDTKGLMRVHQFDKVELVKFVKPQDSYDELEKLLKNALTILELLEVRYRVVALSTHGLSFAASKCYDIEIWAPGVEKWLEVSSCSNFEDFQARRANIRYRDAATKKLEYVHTLNGSGVALARLVVALLENNQTEDGSVKIPKPLQKYMDGMELLSK
jgi:seryl-tRNA synthetase